MERVAVFVDAGYLLERGAEAIVGSPSTRRAVILDEAKAVDILMRFAEAKSKCRRGILRVYWYDAAGSQPSAEQIRLAELDDVKLRLGSFNSYGKQKGVDSLIIADMMELARNGGAEDFLVVGADEDLRVGIQIAQSYGTRVHLLGIDISGHCAQSPGIVREADTTSSWTATDLVGFLTARPAAVGAVSGAAGEIAPVIPSDPRVPVSDGPPQPTASALIEPAVVAFYYTLRQNDVDDIKTVWDANKTIPQPYDGRLLASTAAALRRQLDVTERREMRGRLTQLLQERKWKAVDVVQG